MNRNISFYHTNKFLVKLLMNEQNIAKEPLFSLHVNSYNSDTLNYITISVIKKKSYLNQSLLRTEKFQTYVNVFNKYFMSGLDKKNFLLIFTRNIIKYYYIRGKKTCNLMYFNEYLFI